MRPDDDDFKAERDEQRWNEQQEHRHGPYYHVLTDPESGAYLKCQECGAELGR